MLQSKKLVLIIPPSPWLISDTDLPCLGILYISSYLKQRKYQVDVCDLSGLDKKDWKIPVGDLYGITGTSPNFPQIKMITEQLRERDKNCVIAVGGIHATVLPYQVLENTCADICVVGEGELTMLDLLNNVPLEKVTGIVYKNDSKFITNSKREFITNLDYIPFPDLRSIDFFRYSKSQTYSYLLGECLEATMITARGCPFNCSYCSSRGIWGRKVRYRSVKNVSDEVQYLKTQFNIKLIYFVDDTFVLNLHRVKEMCEDLKSIDIKWHCLNRVDRCTDELAKIMSDSGCVGTIFGFESGSNKILKLANKKANVEQAYKAIEISNKYGIKVRGQMVVGLPGETDETIEETAQFIKKASGVEKFSLHIFQPVPGCDIAANPEKYNYKINKKNDFSDYQTVGKPYSLATNDPKVIQWYNYLKDVSGSREVAYGKHS